MAHRHDRLTLTCIACARPFLLTATAYARRRALPRRAHALPTLHWGVLVARERARLCRAAPRGGSRQPC